MRQHSKSSLFLMELIIAILFFAVSSAICIQLFVYAHTKTQDSRDLSLAMAQCESAAELYRASQGELDALTGPLQARPSEEGLLICHYNAQGVFGTQNANGYQMTLRESRENGLHTLLIAAYTLSGQEEVPPQPVYALTVSVYRPLPAQKEAV